jgi:hypothetical protein
MAISDQRSYSPQPFAAQQYTPPPGTVPKVSGVPVVNDTTSEGGGDHVATIAIPRGSVGLPVTGRGPSGLPASGLPGSGLPQLHDDRGQSGTQLMSHASLRQAGIPVPARGPTSNPSPPQAALTPMPGARPTMQGMGQPGPSQPGLSQTGPHAQPQQPAGPTGMPAPGENADLTTVYRRDKKADRKAAAGKGRGLMIVGIIVFAIVGFAVAALVLRYVRPV